MRNIILQHYTGEPGLVEKLSVENISKYAAKLGAEYRFLEGDVYREGLSPPCQKLYMLDEEFDDYDLVVMIDSDMFTRKGMDENIFEATGMGMSTEFQRKLKRSKFWKFPLDIRPFGTYWGGAIWRLTKEQRVALRKNIKKRDLDKFNGTLEDEGIVHAAAARAGIRGEILSGGDYWCWGSYMSGVETAGMIHIRPKSVDGTYRPKIENLRYLQERGIIA